MKKTILPILLIFSLITQAQNDTTVNWLTFEQTKAKFDKKPKPILIYIYSDTSELCKKMDSLTFKNSEVARYINVLFYPIRLLATTQDTITFFSGEKFVKQINRPYHNLVYAMLGDSISFPALVVFNPYGQGRAFYGFKDRDHIFPILIYYAEKVYLSTDYPIFQKYYFKAYPPGKKQIITKLYIHWLTINEALEKQKQQPRKIFIDLYNNYNVSQTIMRVRVYNNPVIAKYLNTHYYPVTINAFSDEEFTIKGITYKNSGKGQGKHYHQFVIDILNGKMTFPAFVILDENFNLLERIQVFMTAEDLEPILHYYAENKYKQMSFKQFKKTFKSQLNKQTTKKQ